MDDHDAFLKLISDQPERDDNRLIYADWLEENGRQHEADYLRTELELASVQLDSPKAPPLRRRFWQAWSAVDPQWLMIFTQPRLLRANPTPFPSAWWNFALGSLREGQGTYHSWPYESIPPLPLDELRGEFQYLCTDDLRVRGDRVRNRLRFEAMVAAAARNKVQLPGSFLSFMKNPDLHLMGSVTDCSVVFPDDDYSPIQADLLGEGMLANFYCDSQSCLLWDLYIHSTGGHCVIARWPDYFEPDPPEPGQAPYTGPRAWFVAPSFEAFLYRIWLENQIWYLEHKDFASREGLTLPAITPATRAYREHYRRRT